MSAECEFFSSSTVVNCNDSAAIIYTQLLSVDGEWPGGGAATDCEMLPVLKPFVCQVGCDEEWSIEDHTDTREVLVTEEVSVNAPSELVIGTETHLSAAENQLNNQ